MNSSNHAQCSIFVLATILFMSSSQDVKSVPFEEFGHHYQVIVIYYLDSFGEISVGYPSQLSSDVLAFVLLNPWHIFER
jgi:hypothetical protein